MIPYLDLRPQYLALEKEINTRIQNVLNHGQFILGPEVQELEEKLAKYIGSDFALACASGTDALLMILMALDIKPGDEVITTPFSFFATAEVISLLGATPVFVEIDPATYNMDPTKIAAAITKHTKAVMPVGLYGQPADMDEINNVAQKHGLYVVEDAAQSFGANYKKSKSGNLGLAGATSFFPAKPLGCYGDGGALFTNDKQLFEKLKQIRVHGQESRYNHTRLGINGRLDTIQCAVLIEKLKRYDWELSQRRKIAARYTEAFLPMEAKLVPPIVKSDRDSVWAQYTIQVEDRDKFISDLKNRGVPTSVHYPIPMHQQPVYADLKNKYNLPVTEEVAKRVVSLPLYPDMSDADQLLVIRSVTEVLV